MVYMGSKRRIAKDILALILPHRKDNSHYFVDLFMGGCNVVDKVAGNRIANDINPYLVALFEAVIGEAWLPPIYTKDEYTDIRLNKDNYKPFEVGWAGFGCSYNTKWFGGYAANERRNYPREYRDNLVKQSFNLLGVEFQNKPYYEVNFPPNSLVYCDPPYRGTTKYDAVEAFDHERFYDWIREKVKEGHKIWISEYDMPDDFVAIKEWTINSEMHHSTEKKKAVEKLFVHKSQLESVKPLTLF